MHDIVEVDEHGTIQLPMEVLDVIPLHTRFVLQVQGTTLVLRPVDHGSVAQAGTPQQRAAAVRQWARHERPAAPPLPAGALRREQMYD